MAILQGGLFQILKTVMDVCPLMIGEFDVFFVDHALAGAAKYIEGYQLRHKVLAYRLVRLQSGVVKQKKKMG